MRAVCDDVLISGVMDNNTRKSYANDVRANIMSFFFFFFKYHYRPPPATAARLKRTK